MKRTAVIMAGGSGERFWPLSRKRKPKQLLALESDKMMLEQAINRILPIIPSNDIYIITSELLLEPIRKAISLLPPENILAEPFKRNTAPCLALAASFIEAKYSADYKREEISIAVLTADQSIKPDSGFAKTIETTLDFVENNNVIATIGIIPSRPETGYGYIEISDSFSADANEAEILSVVKFHEKPELARSNQYLEAGNYLWNSGMFFWRLDVFAEQMKKHLPAVGGAIDDMCELAKGKTNTVHNTAFNFVADIFERFPDISIDFGLMEKADNVVVAKALFDWDDIGSWDSLDRIKKKNSKSNIIEGVASLHDVSNSTIINKSTDNKIIVAGIGMDNFVIVVTDDAVLVCPKERVQEVKQCVKQIRESDNDKWL
jgi:mannose-1-phosphate guanylyltransferase